MATQSSSLKNGVGDARKRSAGCLLSLLVVALLPSCQGFSSIPRGRVSDAAFFYRSNGSSEDNDPRNHMDDYNNLQEEYFFMERDEDYDAWIGSSGMNAPHHRGRFSVEYSPATPRPPMHPPSWMTLELAEQRLAQAAEEWQDAQLGDMTPALPTLQSMLVGALSGLWTVAPVLYFHCLHHSAIYLFPFALVAAALEAAVLAGTLFWSTILVGEQEDGNQDTLESVQQAIISLFVSLRILVAYCLAHLFVGDPIFVLTDPYFVPFDGLYEVLESVVLFGSSSLAVEAFWSQSDFAKKKKASNNSKKRRRENFQRGTQW